MAIKEVSTWAGLVTALNGFSTGDIIKLTADINLNTEYPQGVDSCAFDQSGYEGSAVTIDGDGHAIINLRTRLSSPVSIFTKTGTGNYLTVNFKNIDFVNLILAGASLVSLTSNDTMIFQNCRFVGSRSGAAYLINNNTNVTLTTCYIDMPWAGAGQTNLSYTSLIPKALSAATTSVANYCWFREKYTGWTYASAYQYNTNDRFFSFSFFKINGCYIDGSMTIPKTDQQIITAMLYFLSSYNTNAYTASAQNVFDVDITAPVNVTNVFYNNLTGLCKMSIKDSSGNYIAKSNYTPWGNSHAYPILATPDQMKDAQALSDLGFDIVVPSE